jgi:hypothetical protein
MRLLLASVATLAAVAFAAPSFAQTDGAPTPTPTPMAKPKPGTTAYCNTLKSSTSRSSCLKKVHAQASTPKAPSSTHKKAKKTTSAPPADTSASAAPMPANTAQSPAAPPQTVAIPPLPQKTI